MGKIQQHLSFFSDAEERLELLKLNMEDTVQKCRMQRKVSVSLNLNDFQSDLFPTRKEPKKRREIDFTQGFIFFKKAPEQGSFRENLQ